MGDVLSQAEIDALLSALSDGQVDAEEIKTTNDQKKVRIYDFRRPNKFSKDQIHSLQSIYENYCRALTSYLSGHLHSVIEIKVNSIDQITYDEFTRSLPSPTILGLFQMSPIEGTMLLEMGTPLAFNIIDLLLGGYGNSSEKNRDLTEIERTIIDHRLSEMVELMGEAWAEVMRVEPKLISVESNAQFTQIVAPNEMILLVTLEVKIENLVGMINICLPFLVLEPYLDKLSTYFLFATLSKEKTPEQIRAMRKKIEWAKVDMTVLLGHSEITVRDLLELAPGDVIPLHQSIDEALSVYIRDFEKFRGIPGLHGEHLAVQLTEIIEEGREQDG